MTFGQNYHLPKRAGTTPRRSLSVGIPIREGPKLFLLTFLEPAFTQLAARRARIRELIEWDQQRRPVWLYARVKRKLPFSSFIFYFISISARVGETKRRMQRVQPPASRAQNNNSGCRAKDAIHIRVYKETYIYITCRQRIKFFRLEHALPLNFSMKNYTRRSLMFMSGEDAILNVTTLHVWYISSTWWLTEDYDS